MPTVAQADITVPPIVLIDIATAVLIVAVVVLAVVAIATVLAKATGRVTRATWPARTWAAVVDYLRPSSGPAAPAAGAPQPRRPGAHRAAHRAPRKRTTAAQAR